MGGRAWPGCCADEQPPFTAPRVQVPRDQDIADLLSALDEGSTAAPGGLYAAALPAAPAIGGAAGSGQGLQGPAVGDEPEAAAAAGAGESGSKVDAVCAAVRAALQRRDKVRRRWWLGCLYCGPWL